MHERKFKAGASVAIWGVAGMNASWELKDADQHGMELARPHSGHLE